MIEAWRLVKAKHTDTAFSGEGARRAGGRWGSVGTALVYTSESLALAELEILVNLPTDRLLASYVAFRVRFETALVEELAAASLPANWRHDPAPRSAQEIGDTWVREERSLVLRVPSAVVPSESNYLLNPLHPGAEHLEIAGLVDPLLDPRLR